MAEQTDTQDIYRTLDLSLRIGEVLLSCGAGAADVSATMLSVARACGLRGAVADVTFTGLTLTHQPRFDAAPAILSRQVQYRAIDYEDLTLVDHLVHDLVLGQVGREEARNRLARVVSASI